MARILVVDDQKSIITVVERLLKSRGHDVVSAADPFDAVEKLRGQTFDLIVTDIMMPGGFTGLELVKTIRREEKLSTTPVVLLTGKREREDVEKGIKAGADDYVVKPIDPDLFLAKIETLLAKLGSNITFAECSIHENAIWTPSMQIVSVSELGLQLVCDVSPVLSSKIQIESPLFGQIGISPPLLNVVSIEMAEKGLFRYLVKVNFVGLTEAHLQPLRLFISSQTSRRSA